MGIHKAEELHDKRLNRKILMVLSSALFGAPTALGLSVAIAPRIDVGLPIRNMLAYLKHGVESCYNCLLETKDLPSVNSRIGLWVALLVVSVLSWKGIQSVRDLRQTNEAKEKHICDQNQTISNLQQVLVRHCRRAEVQQEQIESLQQSNNRQIRQISRQQRQIQGLQQQIKATKALLRPSNERCL